MAGEGLIMEAFSGLDDRFSFSKLTREEEIAEVAFYDKYFNHQPEEEEAARRAVRVPEPCARAQHRVRDARHGLVLPNHLRPAGSVSARTRPRARVWAVGVQ